MKQSVYVLIFTVAGLLGLAGCGSPAGVHALRKLNADAEKTHSPYRYRAADDGSGIQRYVLPEIEQLTDGTDQTIADDTLKEDLLRQIRATERQQAKNNDARLEGVHRLKIVENTFIEIWLISRTSQLVKYYISMKPSPSGGTEYHITGPLQSEKAL